MDPSQIKTSIRPLTHRNKDGIPYSRQPGVEAQIASALALDGPSLLKRVNIMDPGSPEYLQEESLVYFIREYQMLGDRGTVSGLFHALLKRCSKHINGKLKALGEYYKEDAFREVIKEILGELDPKNDDGDFFEVRFWLTLDRLVITVFKHFYQEQESEKRKIRPAGIGGSDSDEIDEDNPDRAPIVDIASNSLSEEQKLMYRQGLASIRDPNHRIAFILANHDNWPIASKNPSEPTISGYFQKTDRTIRNWLDIAEQDLRRWREEVKK